MPSFETAMALIEARLRTAGSGSKGGRDWLCPVHEVDGRTHSPSLTVKRGDEPGTIVLRCAKCDTADVLEAVGLNYSDLSYDDALSVVEQVFHYYPDARGRKHLRVVRTRFSDGSKKVRPEHRSGSGWAKGMGDRERVLYGLPDVLKAARKHREVHLTGGESDADALNEWFAARGVKACATTHGGAGKFHLADYLSPLEGVSRVVVWADRDGVGYRCAAQRLAALSDAGFTAEARLPIPDQPKADVRDHLDAGHTPDDGKPITLAELRDLARGDEGSDEDSEVERALTRLRVQDRARELHRAEKADAAFREPASDLDLASALRREREPLTYTIDRLHPTGSNSLIAAQYKVGKTTLMLNLARAYADGDRFLGEFNVEPGAGRIALFNYELTEEMLLDQYVTPLGIENPERIAPLNLRGRDFDLRGPEAFAFAVKWLRDRGCDALILDPFGAAARLTNENDNSEARNWLLGVLDPLKEAAGIRDLWMPAHTGRGQAEEGNEHVRGASSVDDWADVRWNYTKAKFTEDGRTVWRRFLSAHGRAVDLPERAIDYDAEDSTLYVSEFQSRVEMRAEGATAQVVRIVSENPGITSGALKDALHAGNRDKGPAIAAALLQRLVHQRAGNRNAKHFYPGPEHGDA